MPRQIQNGKNIKLIKLKTGKWKVFQNLTGITLSEGFAKPFMLTWI